jgi:hypothetical protein
MGILQQVLDFKQTALFEPALKKQFEPSAIPQNPGKNKTEFVRMPNLSEPQINLSIPPQAKKETEIISLPEKCQKGHTPYWLDTFGRWHCTICQPPAIPALVKREYLYELPANESEFVLGPDYSFLEGRWRRYQRRDGSYYFERIDY